MLLSLGKADVERRSFLRAGYSAAVSASVLNTGRTGSPVPDSRVAAGTRHVGRADVTAVHDVIALFSRIDQRHGGGHGRSAEHAAAQRYFVAATKLATEADDTPLTGHILRAMAHQAIDLGDPRSGLALAEASVDGSRYRGACPRERALLTVVHAKALSAAGRPRESAKALLRAERDPISISVHAVPATTPPGRRSASSATATCVGSTGWVSPARGCSASTASTCTWPSWTPSTGPRCSTSSPGSPSSAPGARFGKPPGRPRCCETTSGLPTPGVPVGYRAGRLRSGVPGDDDAGRVEHPSGIEKGWDQVSLRERPMISFMISVVPP